MRGEELAPHALGTRAHTGIAAASPNTPKALLTNPLVTISMLTTAILAILVLTKRSAATEATNPHHALGHQPSRTRAGGRGASGCACGEGWGAAAEAVAGTHGAWAASRVRGAGGVWQQRRRGGGGPR